jgi:hypothetical protein
VTPVTDEEFEELLVSFGREAIHLEMRDAYGAAVELPNLARWVAGEPMTCSGFGGWCTTLDEHVKAGKSVRRARIVSEPLSDYQRWSYSIAYPMVEAGEDIRWVPRRRASSVVRTERAVGKSAAERVRVCPGNGSRPARRSLLRHARISGTLPDSTDMGN